MISRGRFEHVGRASIRLEGTTEWGVWLRIDQWSSALGNRQRLRCGALYHVANGTVTFHGVARDAAKLLVPLFGGWTVPSISQLPSVQQDRVDVVVPVEHVFHGDESSHSVASRLPPPSVQPPAPIEKSMSFLNMVHQLIDVCRANQSHLTGIREEVATLRSLVNTLVARPFTIPVKVNREVTSALPEVPPWRVRQTGRQPRVCRREGCSAPVPKRCRVRFCQDYCTSPRCNVHTRQTKLQERDIAFSEGVGQGTLKVFEWILQ